MKFDGMKTADGQTTTYALGHSERELARLGQQAKAFGPFTRQLFEQAGIARGMRVLDVGCGSGDVSFLAAGMVGPEGEVIGIDRAPAAVDLAMARARLQGRQNVAFITADLMEAAFDAPFDAIVGRFVLMYFPGPAAALRRLMGLVRQSGLMVFQEFDIKSTRSVPALPLYDRAVTWIETALRKSGAHTQLGLELFSLYQQAGLPAPQLRLDSLIGGGADFVAYELVTGTVATLLPAMEKFGTTTAAEVDITTLAARLRDEAVAASAIVTSPALIGAWSRVP